MKILGRYLMIFGWKSDNFIIFQLRKETFNRNKNKIVRSWRKYLEI